MDASSINYDVELSQGAFAEIGTVDRVARILQRASTCFSSAASSRSMAAMRSRIWPRRVRRVASGPEPGVWRIFPDLEQ